MAAPTRMGAKLKTNWKHVSAHREQTSVSKQLKLQRSLATVWHCLLQLFYISLPHPPLHLLFKLWWWLPDAPSLGQPSSFLPSRVCWWGQQNLLAFAGRISFPTAFAETTASLHWKISTTKCRTQQVCSVHGVWISPLCSWVITFYSYKCFDIRGKYIFHVLFLILVLISALHSF